MYITDVLTKESIWSKDYDESSAANIEKDIAEQVARLTTSGKKQFYHSMARPMRVTHQEIKQ